MVAGDHRRQRPPMYIERLSFDELLLLMNTMPIDQAAHFVNFAVLEKKTPRVWFYSLRSAAAAKT